MPDSYSGTEKNFIMNLICISTDDYPDQHAAAVRHSTLARGMVELGHNVHFLLLSPQQWKKSELNYHGVKFRTYNSHHETDKLLKVFNFYYGIHKVKKRIRELHSEIRIDAILIFAADNRIIKRILSVAEKENIAAFHERTELPYVFLKKNSINDYFRYKYYLRHLIPRFDGVFVISDKLLEFFKTYNPSLQKILTVVDTGFFRMKGEPQFPFPYIAYCGNMDMRKDGMDILIHAFARIKKDFGEMKLVLIGKDSDENRKGLLLDIIEQLDLEASVIFTGQVDREDMPGLLGNARLLAVAKPDNEQNSGNFPIKVGEYLATGVPAVLTKVGEIPDFIKDGETGFLAEPGSVESFYDKMLEALTDYERAEKIAQNGLTLAREVFDYKKQAALMLGFIENYIKRDESAY